MLQWFSLPQTELLKGKLLSPPPGDDYQVLGKYYQSNCRHTPLSPRGCLAHVWCLWERISYNIDEISSSPLTSPFLSSAESKDNMLSVSVYIHFFGLTFVQQQILQVFHIPTLKKSSRAQVKQRLCYDICDVPSQVIQATLQVTLQDVVLF